MAGKHGCVGETKSGKPCDSWPLPDSVLCISHSPREVQESLGFGGSQPGAGRPRLPKPMDLARQLVERHAVAILRPHFKALGLMLEDDGGITPLASGAVVVYQGELTGIEDLGAQIDAATRLLDRVYGKPRQQTELTGADGGPIQVVAEARQWAESRSRDELDSFLLGVDTAEGMLDREATEDAL